MQEGDIVHYGVKGMRWGVRRSEAQLSSGKSAKKEVPSSADIKIARAGVLKARAQESKNASTLGAKASINLMGEYSKHLSDEYRANPERAIAFRMTTGEKAVTALLAVPSMGGAPVVALLTAGMQKNIAKDQAAAAERLANKK